MKKIAILTLYYHNYNYGGLLQAYALQKSIEKLGCQAEQISYVLESGYENWCPIKSMIKEPLANIYHRLRYGKWFNEYLIRCKKMNIFAKSIPHTDVVTIKTIQRLKNNYDCFVCGSDQIWNPIGWQSTFFFDFLDNNKKRISYAASVSRNIITEEQYKFMSVYLERFAAISVRERNTVELLNKKFTTLNVQNVPDPVFLLDVEEWKNLIFPQNVRGRKYIFAYFLGKDEKNRQKAIRYAHEHNMNIHFASYLDYSSACWDKKNSDLLTEPMGIEDFLQSIANAELVITDSFHAVAFSCIFRVPFYALPRFSDYDSNSMNFRIQNLVQDINIPKRYTYELDEKYEWSKSEIDSMQYNLRRLQKIGLRYLKDNL